MQPRSGFTALGIYPIPQLLKLRKRGPDAVLNLSDLSVPDGLKSPRTPFSDEPYGFAHICRKNVAAAGDGERELTRQPYAFSEGFSICGKKGLLGPRNLEAV